MNVDLVEPVDNVLQSAIRYVPKSLVYSTPYRAIGIAYCNTFKHLLVCIDRSEDIGVIVYSYNEITAGNISGQVLENGSNEKNGFWIN